MKKLLLSLVALLTVTFASAQTSFKAESTGTVSAYYAAYNYQCMAPTATPTVENYCHVDTTNLEVDSIIIRSWCGTEGYDLAITFSTEGSVTDIYPIVNGKALPWSYNGYCYFDTGLSDWKIACAAPSGVYFWEDGDNFMLDLRPWLYSDENFTTYSTDYWEYTLTWAKPSIPTGISSVAAQTVDANAPVYNMAGQRVSANTKGLIIKNGKKYFVK